MGTQPHPAPGIPADSIEAASMRVVRGVLIGQIAEFDRARCGDLPWVSEMRACVGRLELQLGDDLRAARVRPLQAVE